MDPRLAARIGELEAELAEVEERLGRPDTDPSEYSELGRTHARLQPIIALATEIRAAQADVDEARELAASDPGMAAELGRLAEERGADVERMLDQLTVALTPPDPDDAKNAILEIRAAAGGDEAAIWAGDLLDMYSGHATRVGVTIGSTPHRPKPAAIPR
jgi:peptide chain release factor 1